MPSFHLSLSYVCFILFFPRVGCCCCCQSLHCKMNVCSRYGITSNSDVFNPNRQTISEGKPMANIGSQHRSFNHHDGGLWRRSETSIRFNSCHSIGRSFDGGGWQTCEQTPLSISRLANIRTCVLYIRQARNFPQFTYPKRRQCAPCVGGLARNHASCHPTFFACAFAISSKHAMRHFMYTHRTQPH